MLEIFLKKTKILKKALHLNIGEDGEDLAAKYLKKKGYEILEQNWRSHPCELDIICQYNNEIIFVEVKSRSSNNPQDALNAFHMKKQNHIIKAAKHYLTETNNWHIPCRFDLICIYGENKNVEHFENVIELQDNRDNRDNRDNPKKRNTTHSGDTSWQPW